MSGITQVTSPRQRLSVQALEARDVPASIPLIAIGGDSGVDARVRVLNQDTGAVLYEKFAFPSTFRGGVRVAIGDVNGDHQDDVIVGSGPGMAPQVVVYDGATWTELKRFNVPAAASFRGGITVAAGDVDGDGKAEIITGLDSGSLPTVNVFNGQTGANLFSFSAFASTVRTGVRVAAGDLNGDGKAEIVVGSGFGSVPTVRTFDGQTGTAKLTFNTSPTTFRGGLNVAVADTNGDGQAEIITGAGYGGGGKVTVFNGQSGASVLQFTSKYQGGKGGVRVSGAMLNPDTTADVLTSSGGSFDWGAYDHTGKYLSEKTAPGFFNGVWIAASLKQELMNQNSAEVVRIWNQTALDAIKATKAPPPIASRALAMTQIAIFDTVNGFSKSGPNKIASGNPTATASIQAAVIMAACATLDQLFPTEINRFHTLANTQLALIPNGTSKTDGLAWGGSVSNQVIAARANDGSAVTIPYTPGMNPGDWQPTEPGFAAALLPNWGNVKPFGLDGSKLSEYVAPPPPDLTSFTYASDYNITKDYGSLNSAFRTADQTQTAVFWADGGGSFTPPGHWNAIANSLTKQDNLNLFQTAKVLAQLNIGLADAAILCWKTKFQYNYWRPVTAIQAGDTDNNPYTIADPTWKPLLTTPPFPEYVSGHSTFSGAASTILAGFFGENRAFSSTSSDGTITRNFTSFTQAANEAGMSRIYGGIHFMSANINGLMEGRAIGAAIMKA